MSKKPTPSIEDLKLAVKDPERLEAVRNTRMLDTGYEAVFDELTREASYQLKAPLVLLTLVDEYRDFVKSHVGLSEPNASSQEITDFPTFCQLTVAQREPLIINDTRDVAMLRYFPSVRFLGVRAHLGVPLVSDGQPIGNCCVIDFRPRQWTPADIEALTGIATEAMHQLSAAKTRLEAADEPELAS